MDKKYKEYKRNHLQDLKEDRILLACGNFSKVSSQSHLFPSRYNHFPEFDINNFCGILC